MDEEATEVAGSLEGLFTQAGDFAKDFYSLKSEYHSKEYWRERYETEGGQLYDWYDVGFDSFKGTVLPFIRKHLAEANKQRNPDTGEESHWREKCLVVGCGNSEWSQRLDDVGMAVTSTDYERQVVDSMRNTTRGTHPSIVWTEADVMSLESFGDGEFDFVFDKGTCDAIYTGTTGKADVAKARDAVGRCLVHNGVWVVVSNQPRLAEVTCAKGEGGRAMFEIMKSVPPDIYRQQNPNAPFVYVMVRE